MTNLISFNDAYLKLKNPGYTTWVLFFIGPIKYNRHTGSFSICAEFLPTLFYNELMIAKASKAEISAHTVKYDIPSQYACDLILGNEYDLDGSSHLNKNIFNVNRLQLEVYNPHLLHPEFWGGIRGDLYDNPFGERQVPCDKPFIIYQSCHTKDIVLIPCSEVARYCFFPDNLIEDMILEGSLPHYLNTPILEVLSRLSELRHSSIKPNDVNYYKPLNVAYRLLIDPVFKRTANLISSKLKEAFYQMPGHPASESAFIYCVLPYSKPIQINATFVEIGTSKTNNKVYMVNRIVNIFEYEWLESSTRRSIANVATITPTKVWLVNEDVRWPGDSSIGYKKVIQINCRSNTLSFEHNFTFRKDDGWWKNGMNKQLSLNINYSSVPRLVLPLPRIITQKRAVEKEKHKQIALNLEAVRLRFEYLSGYLLNVLERLKTFGWDITYLDTLSEPIFVEHPIMLCVDKQCYKMIIAKLSIVTGNGYNEKTRMYTFYIFECLDLAHGPHHIAVIHSLNLKPITIAKINKAVRNGLINKFFWPRCKSYIKDLKLKLEIKMRYYDWSRRDTSAKTAEQYFRKSIKAVQASERSKFLSNVLFIYSN
ncbi:hypothetical protein [Mucilaginibacter sp. SG564]|uniref:hypothetical protein n=1 Tax=Mucilaginibacter sp. SG564 TaxID=2587022 RepID=UPI0015536E88|nr:hypothetical protein [Mucilaginibacter sp. SG564]NOW94765.1 hypothetical protein [Mucilaginibacter sp. SG564]